jgi:hypothetical protein
MAALHLQQHRRIPHMVGLSLQVQPFRVEMPEHMNRVLHKTAL